MYRLSRFLEQTKKNQKQFISNCTVELDIYFNFWVNSKYEDTTDIKGAFTWDKPPEGFGHWDNIYK